MEPFLNITDFLLLLLWVRLWSLPERELYFNPFLSAPTRVIDRVRPVLPLPGRLVALLALMFLLVFRAVSLNFFRPEAAWEITVGSIYRFVPHAPGVQGAIVFSLLHFFFFVACYWGVYVLIQLMTPALRRDRASEVFHFAALPLSALRRRGAQILLLLAVHGLLVFELSHAGTLNPHLPPTVKPPAGLAFLGCLTLLSVADLLMMAWQLMFALLVGAFVAALFQNPGLSFLCNEGVATMLGTRKRLIVAMIDLTPLLYMMAIYLLYQLLCPIAVVLCVSM